MAKPHYILTGRSFPVMRHEISTDGIFTDIPTLARMRNGLIVESICEMAWVIGDTGYELTRVFHA